MYSLTVSAFMRTNICLKLHVSVASRPMPVLLMNHRLIDKTFWGFECCFQCFCFGNQCDGFYFKSLHVQSP